MKLPSLTPLFPNQAPVSGECVDWRMTGDFLAGASWDQVYAANATVRKSFTASMNRTKGSRALASFSSVWHHMFLRHGGQVIEPSACCLMVIALYFAIFVIRWWGEHPRHGITIVSILFAVGSCCSDVSLSHVWRNRWPR